MSSKTARIFHFQEVTRENEIDTATWLPKFTRIIGNFHGDFGKIVHTGTIFNVKANLSAFLNIKETLGV